MRYWVFIEKKYDGPYTLEQLMRLEGFGSETPVCPEGESEWSPASKCSSIRPQWAAQPLRTSETSVMGVAGRTSPTRGALLEGFLKENVVRLGDYAPSPCASTPSALSVAPVLVVGPGAGPGRIRQRTPLTPVRRSSSVRRGLAGLLVLGVVVAGGRALYPTVSTFTSQLTKDALQGVAVKGFDLSENIKGKSIAIYRLSQKFGQPPAKKARRSRSPS
jgi:hypothetical protein